MSELDPRARAEAAASELAKQLERSRQWAVSAAVFIVAIQVSGIATLFCLLPKWAERGQFGDSFGWSTALFSGAALVGVVWNLVLQQGQIRSQQLEASQIRVDAMKNLGFQEQLTRWLKEQSESSATQVRLALIESLLSHAQARLNALDRQDLPAEESEELLYLREFKQKLLDYLRTQGDELVNALNMSPLEERKPA